MTTPAPARAALRRTTSALACATLLLPLAACGDDADAAGGVTVENCGTDVTFESTPERIVMLKSAAVPALAELGLLDRVVARAGQYPEEYYDDETNAALADIPLLTDRTDASGHLQISREEVIAQRPDLVLGEVENLNRETLASSDIPLIEEPVLCGATGDASMDDVYDQVRLFGTIFDAEDEADAAVADLEGQVEEITARVPAGETRTAAVLYPTVGGGVTYAYGTRSMAAPQLEAAGLTNVFGDVEDRVFEVTAEELIGRDPDVLVLLYGDGDPDEVVDAVTSQPGAGGISAVRDGAVLPLLFNYTEPPSPLSIDGLGQIVDFLAATPTGTP
ncbi:ABC transporter substrate-binding protein [Nocardioides alkalitolerans]|uniref:ABC transporter substrate-binding protein n=1 Tax=Nocardioides alkalitolerans TaxID=281714 RepID=UPI00042A1B85|nr:ABC transporter substrate-binding protein [Nocardioides alkalitolerans]